MKKIADEFGQQPRFNPDFDIKQAVKNDDDAIGFVAQVIVEEPNVLPEFLGMSKNELFTIINQNIKKVLKGAPPDVLKKLEEKEKDKENSFNQLMGMVKKLLLMSGGNASILRQLIFPLLGFQGKGELLKRLYDYVPIVVKGTGVEMEKELVEDSKWDKQQAVDRILDRYNAGEINQQQMQNMMREFAGYRLVFVKTAGGNEIRWEKAVPKVTKTASGKYKMSKETWENIGKNAGWMK